jgi:uncharacterized membrane protein (UPF0127 family)
MRRVAICNLSRPGTSPLTVIYCSSFLCRLRGLTFRRQVPPEEGLLLVQPRDNRLDAAIHMLGVFTDLAVVWINNAGQVVDTTLALRWHLMYFPRYPARYVLEMNPARLGDFKVGDRIEIGNPAHL